MGRFTWRTACLAAALATAVAVPAMAQDRDDDGWWPHWGMNQMMRGGWGGMGSPMTGYGPGAMLDRVDGRLAFLKTELKITDEQLPAWEGLASTVRSTAETHNDMMRAMMDEVEDGSFLNKPLPERLAAEPSRSAARAGQAGECRGRRAVRQAR